MKILWISLLVTWCGAVGHAAPEKSLEQRVVAHTAANGIQLLVLERHFSPTVAIRMMFRTGSVDETSGKTGLAHMFEHMLFKGTKTVGTKSYTLEAPLLAQVDRLRAELMREQSRGDKIDARRVDRLLETLRETEKKASALVEENELWNLYERHGGSNLNAGTSRDFTLYSVDLPSNKLELWAVLDSDRLKNAVFRQFYQERDVVKEERRMRVDNDPRGKLYENFLATAYLSHPYRHPTIGWESDLDNLTVNDQVAFYRQFYSPDRLTIAVVGDVKAAEVIRLVDRYFSDWKPPVSDNVQKIAEEKPQNGPRRVSIDTEAQPYLLMGFHIPAYPDPDYAVYYAISELLANGPTSRLYKSLVEKKHVATGVESSEDYPGERYSSLLILGASPRHPATADDVEKAILKELEELKKKPIEAWELEKVRAEVDVSILKTLQTNEGMATTLAYNHGIFGTWKFLLRFQESMAKITPQDIQRVARAIFQPKNMTVAILKSVPKK